KIYKHAFICFQLSSGNPIYDKHYRQVDPTGSGRVAAADAALFLKRSGLADMVLGKIWDLADSERKGALNKQQFFVALRLVACAQNGLEVALKSLNVAVPPPKFHDTNSPLLAGQVAADAPWVVKPEEKMKFDNIFDSLGPVGGMLSGEKVKPVLLNSKLPVDILGRVWELSDLDRDGMLDKDEFSVAMYLVYRALEGEPVPMSLPPPLVPPSKRKKPWVVSPADKAKFDELFNKTDGDMDGLVSGAEVRDIFLKTGLPSATLARIWELCDIGDIGKLTREQFALALYLINLKLTKGLEPPQSLTPEMIPPSDRLNMKQVTDFSAIKELDSLSNEIVELQREKSSVEEEIKENEEAIRQRSSEVQDLQDEVAKESEELQRLQAQRQKVQDALDELDQQKSSLEEQLSHIRQQTSQETNLISSLQSKHEEQEHRISQYEEELVQAREELLALQEESRKLQEKVQAAQEQLTPLHESVRDSFTQVSQVRNSNVISSVSARLLSHPLRWKCLKMDFFVDDPFKDDPFGKADVADPFGGDPFKGSDPFAADSFFAQTSNAAFSSEDPFSASDPAPSNDPFAPGGTTVNATSDADPFAAVFGNDSFVGGFADFSDLSKVIQTVLTSLGSTTRTCFRRTASLPPRTFLRPSLCPPGKRSSISRTESSESFQRRGNFIPQTSGDFSSSSSSSSSLPVKDPLADPFAPSSPPRHNLREADRFASFDKYPTEEDMIEWAKRESEREEKERLARLTQQEQEDLELAIALSKSELS
uniref:Epidermal growth factor receptor pathway substrate 15 n=1 Tax=Nothobranchius furzeri TaxID=105023 RepID=A0A8C6Q1S9_NOTFU